MSSYALLFVPPEKDPQGILRKGICGSRPPLVHWTQPRTRTHGDEPVMGGYGCPLCEGEPCEQPGEEVVVAPGGWLPYPEWAWRNGREPELSAALVLGWEGRPLECGIDWLARSLEEDRSWIWKIVAARMGILSSEAEVADVLCRAGDDLPGRLIRVGSNGLEEEA